MPTYLCSAAEGQLSNGQKAEIARTITRTHSEVTNAPSYFAQVIFHEVKAGNHFVGGALLDHRTLFVYGTIRSGRTPEVKRTLLQKLTAGLAEATGLPPTQIWIYLAELEGRQIVEYGQILPDPGQEEEWAAALPSELRALMQARGRG